MSQVPWPKVKAAQAADVCQHYTLKEEARPLLRHGLSPAAFVADLVASRQYPAAVDFLAHALPPREAVWWGCICLRHAAPELAPPEQAACKAAVDWVLDPTDDIRQAAQKPGEAAGLATPAGGLALAATWTGGSLAPPKLPAVPPGPFLPAKAVAGAIKLAAAKGDPSRMADTQRLFVELGVGVAEGRFVWPEVPRKAPAKT
jgi:hypothetical protein